jgi:hypothetical protein
VLVEKVHDPVRVIWDDIEHLCDLRTDGRGPSGRCVGRSPGLVLAREPVKGGTGGDPKREAAARPGLEGFGGQVFSVEGDHGT